MSDAGDWSRNRAKRIAVVGAGIVGLSAAWFLQERGINVTVVDRDRPGGGATAGNAGWITPDLAEPLPSPATLRQGLGAVLNPASPVSVTHLSPRMGAFMVRFARNSLPGRFARNSAYLRWLSDQALDCFDRMGLEGVASTRQSPILAVFSSDRACDAFLTAHAHPASSLGSEVVRLSGAEVRAAEPALSSGVAAAVRIEGQRYVDPAGLASQLAVAVQARGGRVLTGIEVASVDRRAGGVRVRNRAGNDVGSYDAVLLANGVDLPGLAGSHGVRLPILPGRGYSFSIRPELVPQLPVYVPQARLACTPMGGRYRIAGVMEFGRSERPLKQRPIRRMVKSATPFFREISPDTVRDCWVGSRPCTPDGLPVLGSTRTPGVFVAGGHGMWGVTLGPASGKVVADHIVGQDAGPIPGFDPLRSA